MRILIIFRALLFSLVFFPLMTIGLSLSGALSYVLTRRRRHIDWCTRTWARLSLWGMGVRLEIQGKENIPQGACLFLFNHSSFVDIFALAAVIPSLRFGAKIELFSIPIFGFALRSAGALPIARHRREHAIRILTEAESRARSGERFALAPEGGRNLGEKLLPFKSGPFIFAINTQIPIVPAVILGAKEVWKKNHLLPATDKWKYRVKIEFLPYYNTHDYTVEKRAELAEKVRESMLPHFP